MASRYRLTSTPQDPLGTLEIRGLSRGSVIDRKFLQGANSSSELIPSGRNRSPDVESDDESTIKDDSSNDEYSPRKVLPGEDSLTVSESSHYWSGANSSTTGNTTERSSLYSWGDDVLDHKTSRDVQEMFHAIERMLFESVLSGSSLLQQECREWMDAFPHLRIKGKQALPVRDEGFQSHPSSQNTSGFATPTYEPQLSDDTDVMNLSLTGTSVTPLPAPRKILPNLTDGNNSDGRSSSLSYLHEEIFEQDGEVEEYLAYDIREMDEDDTVKRYHVPRRRRLGYPPITPNACVRDAVINQLFDTAWGKIISSLDKVKIENPASKKSSKSLWKVLFDSYSSMSKQLAKVPDNEAYLFRDLNRGPYDSDDFPYGVGYFDERHGGILMSQSEHFSTNMAPPSREYYDGMRSGRLSGRHPIPHRDFTSLNSLMMIQRKELLARSDKPPGPIPPDPSLDMVTPTERGPRAVSSRLQLHGTLSPQVYPQFLPITASRQPSAKFRGRGKQLQPPKLQPLDRARTPTAAFNWTLQAKKMPLSSALGLSNLDENNEIVGIRVTSPTDPPPTAPAVSGASLYSKHLPPLPLQSLHEHSSIEFGKKSRRVNRISSAIGEDTNKHLRGWEGASRPNTTHAFRNDSILKPGGLSITPSNISSRPFGSRGMQGLKPSSPTGLGPIPSGSLFYPHNFSQSPDSHIHGLSHGIHGISMMGHTSTSHSPHDHDDEGRHGVWGNPVRRRQVIGN